MNTTSCEGIKIRIIADTGESDQNTKSTKYLLVVNQLLTYDTFIEQLKRLEIIDLATQYLIFLKDQNGIQIEVNNNSFGKVKQRVLSNEAESCFVIQKGKIAVKINKEISNANNMNVISVEAEFDYLKMKVKPILENLLISIAKIKPDNAVIIISYLLI